MRMETEYTLLGLAIALIGAFCALFPNQLMREEYRSDEKRVANFRKFGLFLAIFGLLIIIFLQLMATITKNYA